jgi:hypothetical protein
MIKKLFLLFSFICTFVSFLVADTPVTLFKEEVKITFQKTSMEVRGLYYFENTSSMEFEVKMVFPFPVDKNHPYPEEIEIKNPAATIDFANTDKAVEWNLNFEPAGVETLFIKYNQELKVNSAIYKLKKLWDGKIDKLSFLILVPEDFEEINFSLEPDSIKTEKKQRKIYITKRFFTPENDLKITW